MPICYTISPTTVLYITRAVMEAISVGKSVRLSFFRAKTLLQRGDHRVQPGRSEVRFLSNSSQSRKTNQK